MLARRIAVAVATATTALAAPAAAFATNAQGATPTATPLLLELAVAVGLLARRRLAHGARAAWSRLAQIRASRRLPRPARSSGR